MLMNYVRCDCIKERAIMRAENKVSESEKGKTLALTRQQGFPAMSGGNLLAMPTHSGRLNTHPQ